MGYNSSKGYNSSLGGGGGGSGGFEEYASLSAFPTSGMSGILYLALDTKALYYWDTGTSSYVATASAPVNITNTLTLAANKITSNVNGVISTASIVTNGYSIPSVVNVAGQSNATLTIGQNEVYVNATNGDKTITLPLLSTLPAGMTSAQIDVFFFDGNNKVIVSTQGADGMVNADIGSITVYTSTKKGEWITFKAVPNPSGTYFWFRKP